MKFAFNLFITLRKNREFLSCKLNDMSVAFENRKTIDDSSKEDRR